MMKDGSQEAVAGGMKGWSIGKSPKPGRLDHRLNRLYRMLLERMSPGADKGFLHYAFNALQVTAGHQSSGGGGNSTTTNNTSHDPQATSFLYALATAVYTAFSNASHIVLVIAGLTLLATAYAPKANADLSWINSYSSQTGNYHPNEGLETEHKYSIDNTSTDMGDSGNLIEFTLNAGSNQGVIGADDDNFFNVVIYDDVTVFSGNGDYIGGPNGHNNFFLYTSSTQPTSMGIISAIAKGSGAGTLNFNDLNTTLPSSVNTNMVITGDAVGVLCVSNLQEGFTYHIEGATNLPAGSWSHVATCVASSNKVICWTNTVSSNTVMYYRVKGSYLME